MIFIVVKFPVRPDRVDGWLDLVEEFTQATRAEEGNMFFEWSRSVDDPNEFVLVEAFRDGAAEAHVGSAHFAKAVETMSGAVSAKPRIISLSGVEQDGWGEMGEISPRG